MKQHLFKEWLVPLAGAALLAAGVGLAADQATAAASEEKVKAQIKHGTLFVAGTSAGEEIVLRLRSGDPTMLEVETEDGLVGHNLRRDRFESIVVEAGSGDDLVRIDEANGVFSDTEATTLDGEGGNDELRGGARVETFLGGSEDDKVDGNQGNDFAFLGSGNDSFTWDPGDGSDVIEGQDGSDRMIFNGSGGSEIFVVSAVGPRVEFLRNLGNIDMDLNDVERIDLNTLGGTDTTTVNDLTGTDLKDVNVDLEGALGGGAPDGAADIVTVNATPGVDVVDIFAVDGETLVTGLAATVRIAHSEPALDQLVLNTLAGVDQVAVGAGVAALIAVTVNA